MPAGRERSDSGLLSIVGLPPFQPAPLIRGGAVQTIAAQVWPQWPDVRPTKTYKIDVTDGDRLVVMEYRPAGWAAGQRIALLVHGLNGCYRSRYMIRIGRELVRRGMLVVRVNMRGCGPGFGLARGFNHAGRTEDIRAVLRWLANLYAGSPTTLIGFSLGGNATLKMAGDDSQHPAGNLDSVVAISPPVDLTASARHIQLPENRFYDWYFATECVRTVRHLHQRFPDMPAFRAPQRMRLFDFDDAFTAPRSGYRDAADYYAQSSSAPVISDIRVPALILCALDDPVVDTGTLEKKRGQTGLDLVLTRHGGHMGFLGRTGRRTGSRFGLRWMDALVVNWIERMRRAGAG